MDVQRLEIDGRTLRLADVEAAVRGARVTLNGAARERIERARAMVQDILRSRGMSTGYPPASAISVRR